ncbi:hypothetical protein BJX99DRAFT_227547 [Aspergillus californicus]
MHRYDASFRMKLSCSRCRDRKLKCDRAEPECNRCQTSGFQCSYPDRRKVRGAREKTELHNLGNRVEVLEERLKTAEPPEANNAPTPGHRAIQPSPPTSLSNHGNRGSNTWIYRMVSGAKDSIGSLTSNGQLPSAASPWAQSTADNAITRLDAALVHLADPSPRPGSPFPEDSTTAVLPSDVKRYIDTFLDLVLPHLTIFDSFTTLVDQQFLKAMPLIIDSPHVRIDPAMRIIYHSAMYLGQSIGTEADQRMSTQTYYKCLQSVPEWQESAQGTSLDLLAATLTAWLAINNFDYHLAWEFHSESCRFGDLLGIHDVDSLPLGTPDEESDKEFKRRAHWYLVEMDLLFRLWYDKPTALKCPAAQVKLPLIFAPQTKQPKPYESIIFIVWSRVLFVLLDYLECDDTLTVDQRDIKIDNCCNQLRELIDDWDLLSVARSPKIPHMKSWLYIESLIAYHSSIIFLRRRASGNDQLPHPQAVQAARAIISVILEWSDKCLAPSGEKQGFTTHLITFYPFCAFFTLYHHIISSAEASEYEEDIRSLEKVHHIMRYLASVRPDFIPITDAMGALNDVSRAVHSGQKSGLTMLSTSAVSRPVPDTEVPRQNKQLLYPDVQEIPPFESLQNMSSTVPLHVPGDLGGTFGIPFQLQNQIMFDPQPLNTAPESTESDPARPVPQPLDFVRAIENELVWRNWHESWWNSQGG